MSAKAEQGAEKEEPKTEKATEEVKEKKSSKKASPKKTSVKKASPKKGVVKAAVKKATKKATKKAGVKTTVKKAEKKATKKTTKKVADKEKAEKKKPAKKAVTAEEAEKKEKRGKFELFVAEAIAANKTDDHEWVSNTKIAEYAMNYMEGGIPAMIPRLTRHAIATLVAKKLLKSKKKSYAFTAHGLKTICPSKIPSRKKVERPVKAVPVVEKAPEPEATITSSGRVSKPHILD